MIFDIHTHILPDVDDGSKDADETKRMLRVASDEGIDAIVATPHFTCGMSKKETQKRIQMYEIVRNWWKKQEPDKELYLGNELFYGESLVEALEEGVALTMNGTKYVLVEFPIYAEFLYIQKAVRTLQYAGYLPIIAHVERYENMQDRGKIQSLVDMGAYMQVNVSSVIGNHGMIAQHRIIRYMKAGLIHFVASDAHGARVRRPEMQQCKAYLEKKIGERKTRRILEDNPEKMLKGEEIYG